MVSSADNTQPIEFRRDPHVPMQTEPQQMEHLVDTLVQRTGQPRAHVEKWVTGVTRALKGGFTLYDVSRMAGSFLAKRAQQAKPYLVRFGRSLLQNYIDQQSNLQGNAIGKAKRTRRTNVGDRRAARRNGKNIINKSIAYQAIAKSAKSGSAARSASSSTGHNPWASTDVLRKEPLLILTYPPTKYPSPRD